MNKLYTNDKIILWLGGKDGDERCLVKADGIGRGDKGDGENHDGGCRV
jgi:hypothetical protein